MRNLLTRLLALAALLVGNAYTTQASHIKGVDIYYDYIGSPANNVYVYRIFVALYADCSGGAYSSISNFDINSFVIVPVGTCGTPSPYNGQFGTNWMNMPVAIPNTIPPQFYTTQPWPQNNANILPVQDITPYCRPDLQNTCDNPGVTNPNALPGVTKHLWARDYVFSGSLCTEYILRFSTCCRNTTIGTQIPAANNGGICVESRLRYPALGNSSPRWTVDTSPFMYNLNLKTFNLGPFDPNSDAMTFSYAPVKNQVSGNVCPAYTVYTQGANANDPIPSLVPTTISPTGSVSVYPSANLGDYAATFSITETRDINGTPTILSIIHREITFTVLPPLTAIPAPDIAVFNPSQPFIDSVFYTVNSPTQGSSSVAIPQAYSQAIIEIECAPGDNINARFFLNDTGYVVLITGDTLRDSVTAFVNFPPTMPGAVFNAPIFKTAPLVPTQFLWTPTTPGVYDFVVYMENNLCPLPLENNQTIRVIVCEPVPAVSPIVTVNCNEVQFGVAPSVANFPGGSQWYYSGPSLNSNPNTANVPLFTHYYNQPGTYDFQVEYRPGLTGGLGCRSYFNGQVIIPEGVVMEDGAGGDITVCSGEPAQLGSAPVAGQTYTWTLNGSPTPTGLNSPSIANPVATLTNTGIGPVTYTYHVLATQPATGCQFQDEVSVIVFPKPQATVTTTPPLSALGAVNVCVGDAVNIQAALVGGGTPMSYLWSTGAPLTTDNITLTAGSTNGAVSVSVGMASGCISDPIVIPINVTQPPVAQLAGDFDICAGESTTVTGFGATSYLWSTGQNANSISLSPATTTSYTAQAILNGCVGPPQSFTVTVNQAPTLSFSVNPGTTLCEGQSTVNFTYTGTPGLDPASIVWQFGDGALPGVSGQLSPQNIKYIAPGMPTVRLTAARNGCTATTTQTLTIVPKPTADFAIADNDICFNEYGDGAQRFVMANRSYLSDANATNLQPTYTWQFLPDGTVATGNPNNVGENFTVNFATPGTKTIRLRMQIGQCVDERVQTVVVRPVPPAPTTVGDTVCQGYYGEMRVTAPAGFVYRWYDNPSNDPATRPNFFYQGATFTTPDRLQADRVYWVRSYNNATGCYSNPTSVRTKVHPASTVAIQQSEDTTHLPSAIVTFYAHPNQAQRMAHYIWDFGDGSTSSLPRPTYQYHYPGTFQVTVTTTDTNGCVASGLSKVSVLEKVFFEAPTAFTPDGDLSNDYFHIIPRLMDTSAGFEIRIFNRYGREVYSSTDINFRWDGTTNGTPCPEGIYVYQMRGRTYLGKELVENGTVTLIR